MPLYWSCCRGSVSACKTASKLQGRSSCLCLCIAGHHKWQRSLTWTHIHSGRVADLEHICCWLMHGGCDCSACLCDAPQGAHNDGSSPGIQACTVTARRPFTGTGMSHEALHRFLAVWLIAIQEQKKICLMVHGINRRECLQGRGQRLRLTAADAQPPRTAPVPCRLRWHCGGICHGPDTGRHEVDIPLVGSSMNTMAGFATSSTAMERRLRCSTDSPLTPGRPTRPFRSSTSSTSSSICRRHVQSRQCSCVSSVGMIQRGNLAMTLDLFVHMLGWAPCMEHEQGQCCHEQQPIDQLQLTSCPSA